MADISVEMQTGCFRNKNKDRYTVVTFPFE